AQAVASRLLTTLTARLGREGTIDLLKYPTCIGPARAALLRHLGKQLNREFRTVWELVDWLESHEPTINLSAPARRPGTCVAEPLRPARRWFPSMVPAPVPQEVLPGDAHAYACWPCWCAWPGPPFSPARTRLTRRCRGSRRLARWCLGLLDDEDA